MRHLAALVAQKEWGVRLAGLLGIKYVLAARLDQAGALLPAVLPAVLTGLKVCASLLINLLLLPAWLRLAPAAHCADRPQGARCPIKARVLAVCPGQAVALLPLVPSAVLTSIKVMPEPVHPCLGLSCCL